MRDHNPSILLVDDQPKLARLVTELLHRLGFPDVDEANDGVEALRKLQEKPYGLVIADLVMQPIDGMQLLRAIRTDRKLMNTPFMLTEASITFEQVTMAHHMGADAFLLKPFDITLFKTKLKTVLRSVNRKRERPAVDWPMSSHDLPSMQELTASFDER
jgi:DNA-binding response OmpR family regulator